MIKIYGSMLCKDCVQCREDLDKAGIAYEYLDFADNLLHLKEFLAIREGNPIFDEVRKNGGIGIPCIVKEGGTVLLDWEEFM
jgi:glutaredoxin-related protein